MISRWDLRFHLQSLLIVWRIYVQEKKKHVVFYWCEADIDGESDNNSSWVGWDVRIGLSNFE